ncbi:MAG TPA: iron-sulfur cluster assembly accessory protein [Candidatus Eisenbacteria bacterium]|nr:iron-sulfur cluster assembly accessory protein [Candidatus Eisenbacteria bacterium]
MSDRPYDENIRAVTVDLKVTPAAARQVKALLERDKLEGYGLRVGVTDGGCSGYSYQLKFEKEPQPGDQVLELEELRVFIDSTSAELLNGTVLDYAASLYGGGFKFVNPNATATCGCGTSFSA